MCTNNVSYALSHDGNYEDYIELYNPTNSDVSLEGFAVSKDIKEKEKSLIKDVIVPKKGYVILRRSTDDYAGDFDFGLSKDGCDIKLYSPAGDVIDEVSVPSLSKDTAYARIKDEWQIRKPSPSLANDLSGSFVKAPVFSVGSGFYDKPFKLEISDNTTQPDIKIYYTLDSSVPTGQSNLYTEPINIDKMTFEKSELSKVQNVVEDWKSQDIEDINVDKITVVRAVCVDSEGNSSDVVTASYFVGADAYKDENVLSIVADYDDLFGPDGIHVTGKEYDEWYLGGKIGDMPTPNFEKHGIENEILANIDYFEDSEFKLNQLSGLRIQGGGSRSYEKKRLSIYSRKEYSESNYFDYDFFDENVHSIVLREDWVDPMIHSLVADRENVMIQQYIPVTVFLNGEKWYKSYIREKYSEKLIAERFHLDDDDITMVKGTPQEVLEYAVQHADLSSNAEYENFCNIVDVDSYIDWLCINIYICNMDASEWKNCIMWKSNTITDNPYSDGKWRFVIFDTECLTWAVEAEESVTINSFNVEKTLAPPAYNQHYLFKAFRTNPQFIKKFALTFMDLVNENFSVDRVSRELAKWSNDIKWNNEFFARRADYIVSPMAWEFGLTGTLEEVTLKISDAEAGSVSINSITPDVSGADGWTGRYYTDYPVTINAKANEGYRFVGWSDGQNILSGESMEFFIPTGGCAYEAVFEKE